MEFGAMKIDASVYRSYEGNKCNAELEMIKRIDDVLYVEMKKETGPPGNEYLGID